MAFEIALTLILASIMIYVTLVKTFGIMFRITGLPKNKAMFRAISLFTNCGFTTGESEIIVNNTKRRKLAMACMIIGHVFSVIFISLIFLLFQSVTGEAVKETLVVSLIAFGAFVIILIVFRIPFFRDGFENFVGKVAQKMLGSGKGENTITILDTFGNDAVVEIFINNLPELFKNKTLIDSNVKLLYNINILSLKRKNKIVEVSKDIVIQNEDTILVFGPYENIKMLFKGTKKDVEVIDSAKIKKENAVYVISNYGSDAMAEIIIYKLPECLINSPLKEGMFGDKIKVLLIKKRGLVFQANAKSIIEEGDVVTVFGDYQAIKEFFMKGVSFKKERRKEDE